VTAPASTPLRTHILDWYPDLRPFQDAALRSDWPALAGLFAGLTDVHGRILAESLVNGAVPDGFLEGVVAIQRSSHGRADTVALALLGARLIGLGWKVRTSAPAKDVSEEQFREFREYLVQAEQLLIEATARDPGEPIAWTERLTSAMGLSLGQSEARRRYDRLGRRVRDCFQAQKGLIQYLSPKWGGTYEMMHAFAHECLDAAPPGALNGAVVADAHIEHWLKLNWDGQGPGDVYMATPAVQADLVAAAARSVLHPDYRPVYGWVSAHSAFAVAFSLGGNHVAAAPHFRALGPFGAPSYIGASGFAAHRDLALLVGG